ncbi:glycosyl transferase family 1 [Microvirga sp. 17 mud 1-3]|nr:glycosyl transferase family 1 [Microvirga sp. 17 mud 1-3]
MARLLLKALEEAGFRPDLASELRTLDRDGNAGPQEEIRTRSDEEAIALIAAYERLPPSERPRLWFTYHVYYKAPDWIGPRVAEALGIPYVVAEGSRAQKRADGPWAIGHRGAEEALDHAGIVFAMTDHDRKALEAARPAHQAIVDLPPFLDIAEWGPLSSRPARQDPRLLAVAMMRPGDKLASYRILAEALSRLGDRLWSLDIVGDGEAREEIEALFAPSGGRVRFHGQVEDREQLRALYEEAGLFVWPAVNEAYGMVFLEAQLFGCPVVAGAYGGVAGVVRDGTSGLLVSPGDPDAFARGIATLLDDPDERSRMGEAARLFVTTERSLAHAATRLRDTLMPLVETGSPSSCGS